MFDVIYLQFTLEANCRTICQYSFKRRQLPPVKREQYSNEVEDDRIIEHLF